MLGSVAVLPPSRSLAEPPEDAHRNGGGPRSLALAAAVSAGLAALLGHRLGWDAATVAISLVIGWLSYTTLQRALGGRPRLVHATSRLPAWGMLGASLVAAVLLFAAPRNRAEPSTAAAAGQPSLLLVTIDTLRADCVGAYGHRDARTPVLDRLAREGFHFDAAISPAVLTGPAHLTMLSGLTPDTHGVTENSVRASREIALLPDLAAEGGCARALSSRAAR